MTVDDDAIGARVVLGRDVNALYAAALLVAATAVVLPLFADSDVFGLQVVLAIVGFGAFAVGPFVRRGVTVALGAVALECVMALPGTEFLVVVVPVAGVGALAAAEALSLVRMWRSRGVLRWDAEQPHVTAALERIGAGTAAALVVTVLGFIELPSAAVIVTLGAVALGAVVWTLADRSG